MKTPRKTLSEVIIDHIAVEGTRLETLLMLVGLFIRFGSVCLWRLAAHVEGEAQVGSVRRRFYRFFQLMRLDQGQVARLVISVLGCGDKPLVLVMDRTNWAFGRTHINILMLCVVWQGIGIPLMWKLLPHQGNSSISVRIDLMRSLLEALPALKVARLMGDREFIGEHWMRWCRKQGVPFVLRLRENQMMYRAGYEPCALSFVARSLSRTQMLLVKEVCTLAPQADATPVRVVLMRLNTGELLALACTGRPRQALAFYRQRWNIEMLFASLKTRGFHLEDTHLNQPDKLSTLLALLAIAAAWVAKTALKSIAQKPIATNKKGKTQSLFSKGLEIIRKQWADHKYNNMLINKALFIRV